jgi:hypothetical protein
MPTAAFLEASNARQRHGEKISSFAITFPKAAMFSLGARPVIYGLSGDYDLPSGVGGGPRLMDVAVLPLHEQYRYVTYNPSGSRRVDWTHEREWRWPFTGDIAKFEKEIEEMGIVDDVTDIPGLDFFAALDGIGVIVNTNEEAKKVLHDILVLVDRDKITHTQFSYILVTDNIPSFTTIRDSDEEQRAIAAAAIDLTEFLQPKPAVDSLIAGQVHSIIEDVENSAEPPEAGELGGCWIWLLDNTHPVTRSLVNEERVEVNSEGKYLLFPYEFSDSRSLRQREEMTRDVARRLQTELGVTAGYFSVLNSDNPDAVPWYNDDHLDDRLHYNWANDGL